MTGNGYLSESSLCLSVSVQFFAVVLDCGLLLHLSNLSKLSGHFYVESRNCSSVLYLLIVLSRKDALLLVLCVCTCFKMTSLQCINCNVRLSRIRRHALSDESEDIVNTIRLWTYPRDVSSFQITFCVRVCQLRSENFYVLKSRLTI